jgi:transposase
LIKADGNYSFGYAHYDTEDNAEQLNSEGPAELVLDKGYHSNDVMVILKEVEVRSYCSEPDRGRRNWIGKQEEKSAVYQNRRRIRGDRGKRLLRQRGERVERSFAHMYETGGMRRVHLRGHGNIIKRLLIHAGAFNLSTFGSISAPFFEIRSASGC